MPIENNPISLLIVDDEKGACDNLKNILFEYTDANFGTIGVAHDTVEAGRWIKEYNPDAVFLDIAMPKENGFQFLERIYPYNFEIIFVTAYDALAIRAFKLNAVDYILKPINIRELVDAIKKLRERLNYKSHAKTYANQIETVKQISNKELAQKITLKSLNHIEVVDFKDIYYIEGQGNYCKVCYNKAGTDKDIITSGLISHYEELLPTDLFYRVHKSFLVNCSYIEDIIYKDNYSHSIILKSKSTLLVSRRRHSGFINFLKENKLFGSH